MPFHNVPSPLFPLKFYSLKLHLSFQTYSTAAELVDTCQYSFQQEQSDFHGFQLFFCIANCLIQPVLLSHPVIKL